MCQITFDDMPQKITENIPSVQEAVDSFGCCGHYRECSNLRKCLFNDDTHKGCQYRINLENGHIFYGKNAEGFDKDRYARLENSFINLPFELQKNVLSIIRYAIESMTSSCFLLCDFNKSVYEFVSKFDTTDYGFTYSNNIDDYTFRFSLPTLRLFVSECGSDIKFNKIDKAMSHFKGSKILSEYIFSHFIFIRYDKSFTKYYTELFYDHYADFKDLLALRMTDLLIIRNT